MKDFSRDLSIEKKWKLHNTLTGSEIEVNARVYLNFDANAKYVAFYVPELSDATFPEAILMNNIEEILALPNADVGVSSSFGVLPNDWIEGKDLNFTGRVFFYSERDPPDDAKTQLISEAATGGVRVIFRSNAYLKRRIEMEKPKAFISHDSRDKFSIAGPLAIQMQRFMCPVWYDEFSLKVGDSLREGIETGLKECPKCILILTPNFLTNNGWSKREYDSIFTRELVERQQVILPVWSDVDAAGVYEYSPILADRVAVNWSLGVEEVARRLVRALDT
ncbi:toll/interleukin-1 receptor domain-containing protein [Bradyrhizobium sp. CCBAU 65884]|uniref:toll/interleukin-1 receptor domain-containing protein n=1 Tax=Bradyrhizobium sp. CCBAU 65884 TaxID=722477 RepID=UPI002305F944|nr:toll/interleukin-1 receptor domain-containing protein [Bradyrhizobium sp. CCBAU 65884]